ncbi:MAG: flagellar export chaperone FliS [Verrucomicrobia bacterium]|nr:flagellar export chaperone FliS [Verrucomicrobiota bacterium]MBI3870727.1 flagellar export chaperone FliS [Verrucomicrobiota bacterium]
MTYGNPWQSYRQVATRTASPGALVLMLYDGAIRFLNQALQGFEREDPLEFHQLVNNNLLRAQEIINELNLSLNMAEGGEFAQRMRGLYTYFDSRLQQSNAHKKPDGIHDVLQRLTIVRDAWAEMQARQGDAAPSSTGTQPSPSVSLEAQG